MLKKRLSEDDGLAMEKNAAALKVQQEREERFLDSVTINKDVITPGAKAKEKKAAKKAAKKAKKAAASEDEGSIRRFNPLFDIEDDDDAGVDSGDGDGSLRTVNPLFESLMKDESPSSSPSPRKNRGGGGGGSFEEEDISDAKKKDAMYKDLFNKYDADSSGTIDVEELGNILIDLGHSEFSEAELADIITKAGDSSDVTTELNYELFRKVCEVTLGKKIEGLQAAIEESIFGAAHVQTADVVDEGEGDGDPDRFFGLLHPENQRRQMYDVSQMFLLIWTLYAIPMRIAFNIETDPSQVGFWVDACVDGFFMMDLFVQMHTYYRSGRTGRWVSHFGKVRKKYLRSWFVMDFIAVFPADYLLRVLKSGEAEDARSFRMVRLARMIRYARMLKMLKFKKLDDLEAYIRTKIGGHAATFVWKSLVALILIILFCHLVGLAVVFIGRSNSALIAPYGDGGGWWDNEYGDTILNGGGVTISEQYVTAIYFVLMTLSSVGYGDVLPRTQTERFCTFVMLIVASFIYANIIGNYSDLIVNRRRDKNNFESKMRSVNVFLESVECPQPTVDKVRDFYKYKYPSRTLFDENAIFHEVPLKVRNEIVLHRFMRTIQNVPFFRGCSNDIVVDICLLLEGQTVPPAAVIVDFGDTNADLCIVSRGSATGSNGQFDIVYEAGSFFGELLFLGVVEESNMSVVANEFSELFGLRISKMAGILDEQKELHARLLEYAKLRKQAMDIVVKSDLSQASMKASVEHLHLDAKEVEVMVREAARAKLEVVAINAFVDGKLTAEHFKSI